MELEKEVEKLKNDNQELVKTIKKHLEEKKEEKIIKNCWIRLRGEASIGVKLSPTKAYGLMGYFEFAEVKYKPNHDGTWDEIMYLVPDPTKDIVVINESGQQIKVKPGRSQAQMTKLTMRDFYIGKFHNDDKFEKFYETFQKKLRIPGMIEKVAEFMRCEIEG